jgi:hypothetical protein
MASLGVIGAFSDVTSSSSIIQSWINMFDSATGRCPFPSSLKVLNQQLLVLNVQNARYVVYSSLFVICSVLFHLFFIISICLLFRYLYPGSFLFSLLNHDFISHRGAEYLNIFLSIKKLLSV